MKHTLLAVLVVLAAIACGGSDGPPSSPFGNDLPDVAGTYQLQSVNDGGLPALFIQENQVLVEVTQGTLVIRSDSGLEHTLTLRITDGGQVSTQANTRTGSWRWSRLNVFLTYDDGGCSDLMAPVDDRLFVDDCDTGNRFEYVK
jgi:hypothetical protein